MSESCDEYCTIHEKTLRKARKEHDCCACGRVIRPGQRYANVFTVYDGNAETFKRCGACEATWVHLLSLCERLNRETCDNLYPREDLGCGLKYQSEWGELPDEIARLAFMTDEEASALLESTS